MKKKLWKLGPMRRGMAFLLALTFLLSMIMSGTYAWQALASASNDFSGAKGNYQIELRKLEKDIDGKETETSVSGARFYLFQILDKSVTPEEVRQIGDIYTTDEQGKIQVTGLTTGEYYFLEADPSYGYTYDKDGEQEKTRYDFAVNTETATDDVVKVVVYNQRLSSSLTLTKSVVNCDGTELSPEQTGQEWMFTVRFSDGKQYPYTIDGGPEQTLTPEGTLTLKHGQTATFPKVPVGVRYEVSEAAMESYVISSSNSSGNIQMDAAANQVQFTNTYKPAKVGSLEIVKIVTGGDAVSAQQEFLFTVEIGKDAEAVHTYLIFDENSGNEDPVAEGSIKNGEQLTLKDGQKAVFEGILVGTTYAVSENDYSKEGYTTLLKDQNGSIAPGTNQVTVINQKEALGELLVTKTVENEDGSPLSEEQKEKAFAFTAVIGDTEYHFILKSGEDKRFENIPVGTKYTVLEDDYITEGYVTLASGNDGNIGLGETQAAFINRWIPEPEKGTLTITKTVKNEDGSALTGEQKDKKFTFQVQIGDDPIQTIELKHGESHTFKDLPGGTHYTVLEEDTYAGEGYITSSSNAAGSIHGDVNAAYTNTKGINKGDLTITKSILNADGSEVTEEQKGIEFTFQVEFSDKNDHTYRIDGGKEQVLEKGGKLVLKAGQKAFFKDLPAGISYTVKEEASKGYLQGSESVSGTIGAGSRAEVPFVNVKQVENTKILVKKVTEGEGADLNKKFTFTLTTNQGTEKEKKETFELANGEEKEFTLPYGTPYQIQEGDYLSEGYSQSSVIGGSGTAGGDAITVTFTNRYLQSFVTRDLAVEKKWDVPEGNKIPDAILVYVMRDGQTVASAELTQQENWSHTFKGLPKYDQSGAPITYTVKEKELEGYVSEVTEPKEGNFIITNTAVETTAQTVPLVRKQLEIQGEKPKQDATFSFLLKALGQAPMPADAKNGTKTIHITGEGSSDFGEIAYGTTGTYLYQIYEQNNAQDGYTYDSAVYTYTVEVTEQEGKLVAEGSLAKTEDDAFTGKEALFTNAYNQKQQTTSLSARKIWAGEEDPNRPQQIEVQLYKDGAAYEGAVVLSDENGWNYSWTNLETQPDTNWELQEITDLGSNYTKSITSSRDSQGNLAFTVTNTFTPPESEYTALTVNKVWAGDGNYTGRPESVQVQLYRNGEAYGETIGLSSQNSWTHTWANLEKGEGITWTAGEPEVPTGYKATMTQNGERGYTITNTYLGSGNKPGNNGGNNSGGNTGSNNGSTGSGGNKGSGSGTGGTPQTDDPTMMWLWFVVMIVSAAGLRFAVFYKNPAFQKERPDPKQ